MRHGPFLARLVFANEKAWTEWTPLVEDTIQGSVELVLRNETIAPSCLFCIASSFFFCIMLYSLSPFFPPSFLSSLLSSFILLIMYSFFLSSFTPCIRLLKSSFFPPSFYSLHSSPGFFFLLSLFTLLNCLLISFFHSLFSFLKHILICLL